MKMRAFTYVDWSRDGGEEMLVPISRFGKKRWLREFPIDIYGRETLERRFEIVPEPFLFPGVIRELAWKVEKVCRYIRTR